MSRDGSRVLFSAYASCGMSAVQVVAVDGGPVQTVVCTQFPHILHTTGAGNTPAWTPGDRDILFTQSDGPVPGALMTVYAVAANGGTPRFVGTGHSPTPIR